MVKALFDTNILIDHLNGVPAAAAELARYDVAWISIITWMEVMIGASSRVAAATEQFLARFEVVQVDNAVARRAVALRRAHRLKLPDALVWASAQVAECCSLRGICAGFRRMIRGVRVPYTRLP